MLEPFVRPRTGQALNGAVVLLAVVGAIIDFGVTTVAGEVPGFIVMPMFALAFAARVAGLSVAIKAEGDAMPWVYRVTSWALVAFGFLILDLLFIAGGAIVFGVFVALDAAGAVVPWRKKHSNQAVDGVAAFLQRRLVWIVAFYVVGFLILHFLYAATVEFGPLVDWAYLCLGFALYLRYGLLAGRAPDAAQLPPRAHRVHEPVDDAVTDPLAASASDACSVFLRDGDAGPLLDLVRASAKVGGLKSAEADDLERRVVGALTRAGTSRHDDLNAAVAALEDTLRRLGPARAHSLGT